MLSVVYLAISWQLALKILNKQLNEQKGLIYSICLFIMPLTPPWPIQANNMMTLCKEAGKRCKASRSGLVKLASAEHCDK